MFIEKFELWYVHFNLQLSATINQIFSFYWSALNQKQLRIYILNLKYEIIPLRKLIWNIISNKNALYTILIANSAQIYLSIKNKYIHFAIQYSTNTHEIQNNSLHLKSWFGKMKIKKGRNVNQHMTETKLNVSYKMHQNMN